MEREITTGALGALTYTAAFAATWVALAYVGEHMLLIHDFFWTMAWGSVSLGISSIVATLLVVPFAEEDNTN